jgi:hypothetical protein
LENRGYVVRDRDAGRRVIRAGGSSERPLTPFREGCYMDLRKSKKEELNLIYQSVQKLVEITEAQNLKGTFFYDQE